MKAILKIGVRELDLVCEYTGHPYDPVLVVYYARARMYDAADRRFMAVDPVKEGENGYLYCNNNPKKYTDPTGMFLRFMYISEGARGENVERINNALYSLKNKCNERYLSDEEHDSMDKKYFGMETTGAVKKFQGDKGIKVTGIVNETTWRKLGLSVNTTLEEEFKWPNDANATINVTIKGNNIDISYSPSVHIQREYFKKVVCDNPDVKDEYEVKTTEVLKPTDIVYSSLVTKIKNGCAQWGGSYSLYGISSTVLVSVDVKNANSRLASNLIITTNVKGNNFVPTTLFWCREKVPTMYLNLGYGRYWTDRHWTKPSASVENLVAHEFGHVLGVFDAYSYAANPTPARESRAPEKTIMWGTDTSELAVTPTEIKMVLYAFSRNVLQTYEYTWYGGEESTAFFS